MANTDLVAASPDQELLQRADAVDDGLVRSGEAQRTAPAAKAGGRPGTWTSADAHQAPAAGTITLSVSGITTALVVATMVVATLGLLLGAVLSQVTFSDVWLEKAQGSLVRLFSLDTELNIPTWYNSLLLLLCSAFSGTIAFVSSASVHDRFRWLLMSGLFVALSIDESASIHEMAIWPMQELFNTSGYLKYGWVVPGAILVAIVALYYLRFVLALPRPVRFRFFAGAGTFVTGALVVEAITAKIDDVWGTGLAYQLAVVVEETLEMLGLVIIISGLLIYLRSQIRSFDVRMAD